MVTFHPTAKRKGYGFVPMVTIRGRKGRMVGSRCMSTVFATAALAESYAYEAALNVAARFDFIRVA